MNEYIFSVRLEVDGRAKVRVRASSYDSAVDMIERGDCDYEDLDLVATEIEFEEAWDSSGDRLRMPSPWEEAGVPKNWGDVR